MQIQQCEASTHQYLGSQDAYIQISMTSVGKEPVKNLVKMIRDAERYTRDYKFGMVCGYLGINNPIVNLFGVRYTLVENVTVNTVRGFPDRYEIVLTLIGFDKTQRRSERLKSLNTGEGVNLNNVKSFYGMEEVIVEERLKNIEVYPDLELPTWDELKTFTTKANINYIFPQEAGWSAGKFVDHVASSSRSNISSCSNASATGAGLYSIGGVTRIRAATLRATASVHGFMA